MHGESNVDLLEDYLVLGWPTLTTTAHNGELYRLSEKHDSKHTGTLYVEGPRAGPQRSTNVFPLFCRATETRVKSSRGQVRTLEDSSNETETGLTGVCPCLSCLARFLVPCYGTDMHRLLQLAFVDCSDLDFPDRLSRPHTRALFHLERLSSVVPSRVLQPGGQVILKLPVEN